MVFNALNRRKEPLRIPADRMLTLYVCGPTVYAPAHLGHARTYTLFDTMQRVLQQVFHVTVVGAMNITDVDDKIINAAAMQKKSISEVARKAEADFWQDMDALGVRRPACVPRATEFIPEMLGVAKQLMDGGLAYRTQDGSVYLDVERTNSLVGYPGSLGSGRVLAEASEGESQSGIKRHPKDFCLWKASEGDAAWDGAPVGGRGRPGWHLECSAMVESTVGRIRRSGPSVDLHGGGIDLCFPHHCNERAQGQALLALRGQSQDEWATCFVHTGHVLAGGGEKMAKSLANATALKDATAALGGARQLRLYLVGAALYSSSTEWTQGAVDRAKAMDALFNSFLGSAPSLTSGQRREEVLSTDARMAAAIADARRNVVAAFADDFNFPLALQTLQAMVRRTRAYEQEEHGLPALAAQARELVRWTLSCLGVEYGDASLSISALQNPACTTSSSSSNNNNNDALPELLVRFRAEVRTIARTLGKDPAAAAKLFALCDDVRVKAKDDCGVLISDGAGGHSTWLKSQSK